VLAGIFTIVVFRVLNPYAFMGPGILGLRPNTEWLADIAEAQRLVSGAAEMPPNWQWVGRPSYLFPLWNMILWGMGVGFGLAGWLSLVAAIIGIVRGRAGAAKNLLLAAWVVAYFLFVGGGWVMSMRYYLPLYPVLAVLAAWGLVALVKRWHGYGFRRLLAWAALVGVVGFTVLWGVMFHNIYRHLSTPVQAGIWVWENAPGDFAMTIDGAPEGTPLVNIALPNGYGAQDLDLLAQASRIEDGQSSFMDFVAPASGTISSVRAPHLGDPLDDEGDETINVRVFSDGLATLLGETELTANFSRENNVLGDEYLLEFAEPFDVEMGQTYTFVVEVADGGPVVTGGAIFSWEGDWDEVVPPKTCVLPLGTTLSDDPPPGMFDAYSCRGRDPWTSLINGYKQQIIYEDVEVKRDRLQLTLDNSDYIIIGTNRRYDSQNRIPTKWAMTNAYYDALFSGELGFEIEAMFQETFELGPLMVSDQYLPQYDAPRWLNEFEAEEAFHVYDHPVVYIFRKTDAYSAENTAQILGSVPLTGVGQINFACPEAQDLTTVNYYCDPTLAGIYQLRQPLTDVSLSADQSPLALQFGPDMRDVQTDGGTWSNRFNSSSPINTQPVLTVLVWWIGVMLFGWAVWPLLYVALPGLADRGYGLAKFFGMFLVGWLTWMVASARVPAWSQIGIAVSLLAVMVVGIVIAWRTRAKIIPYIQDYWRRLFAIEAITLLLFLAFFAVRLSNPDLWHPAYGGEKPMDFAYFNGVLRSSVFPAIDPWYAGGYINYYYFGYVIVGAPTLLLGIVPSIAYNLIVPTLFALTGIAAFSVAFNVVSGWRSRRLAEEAGETRPKTIGNPWVAGIAALLLTVVLGNLDTMRIIMTELGELGGYQQPPTMETFLLAEYEAANNGQGAPAEVMADIFQKSREGVSVDRLRYEWSNFRAAADSVFRGLGRAFNGEFGVSPDRWFWGPTRVLAEPPVNSGGAITELPYFTFLYGDLHAHMISMPLQLFVLGFLLNEVVLAGRAKRTLFVAGLSIFVGALATGMLRATNTWDWVTFMVLGVAGLGYVWWLRWSHASRSERGSDFMHTLLMVLALASLVGGILAYFVTRELGTLSVLGLGAGVAFFVAFLFWDTLAERLTRWSVVDLALRIGGFVAISFLVAVPFTTWYAATYNRVLPWEGNRTPIWAYLDIHGLFLFLIFSLLVWDTARWFNSTYVSALRGRGKLIAGLVALTVVMLAASFWLAAQSYQVTLIALPLLVWLTVLFFRSGQSRMMQFIYALAGLALGLTLAVEYVVLDGDIGRQNTVFKFYIQVWLLFGVAGGAAFAWLASSLPRWNFFSRGVWTLGLGALVFIAALYPFLATPGKAVFRMAPNMPLTLDGMDYMQYSTQYEGSIPVIGTNAGLAPFSLADDYNVIRWLQENVQGSPVIMEGRSEREYLWGSRISVYTGLPSVVGWNWHQRQQRTFDPLPRIVEQRVANVNAFYVTSSIPTAWDILEFYKVEYIIVSGLERAYYPQADLDKFDTMVELGLLEVAYEEGNAIIYHVIPDAELEQETEIAGLDRS
jgi:YYY domain-containing protein